MGQSDVRKRVVGAIPADLIYVKKFQMLRKCCESKRSPASGWRPSTFVVVLVSLLKGKGRPHSSSGRLRRGRGH